MNIEMMGVNFLKLAIAKTDYLVPHINDNDKEPSWDGDIEVYKKAGNVHSKSDLLLKIPVQVKGKIHHNLKKPSISYPIEITDLRNYLNAGGTVFFVVYVDEAGERSKIYYVKLLPYDIKKIISEAGEQDTKSVKLKPLPERKEEIAKTFVSCAKDIKRQRAAISSDNLSLDDLVSSGNIPELSFSCFVTEQSDGAFFQNVINSDHYLYAKLSHGVELPVEHIEEFSEIKQVRKEPVSVNGQVYYDEYTIIYKKDMVEFKFGKSITHCHNLKNNEEEITFKLEGTLEDRIRDQSFMLEVLDRMQFEIGGIECPLTAGEKLDEELQKFDVLQKENELKEFKKIKETLERLEVQDELDFYNLDESDCGKIGMLVTSILEEKAISLKDSQNGFAKFSINNLNILVCILEDEPGSEKYRVYGFNDCPVNLFLTNDEGEEEACTQYLLLKKDIMLSSCNINYTKLLECIKHYNFTELFSTQVNLLLLEILKVHDEYSKEEREKRNFDYIVVELSKYLMENDPNTPDNILKLNYLQAIKRTRDFDEKEIEQIYQVIEESSTATEEELTGAYLLLDNYPLAKKHFDRMDKPTQENFKLYPIWNFWKEAIGTTDLKKSLKK